MKLARELGNPRSEEQHISRLHCTGIKSSPAWNGVHAI